MDFIQDYATLLPQLLPPSILTPLITFVTATFGLFKTLQTHLTPLLLRLSTQPDIASILMLVTILFVSFKILGMAYRAVMFWVTLVFKLVLWGTIAVVGFWMYNRGFDGFAEDVQGLAEYWSGELDKYSDEVRRFQTLKEQQIRMKTGSGGRGNRGWR